MLNYFEDIVDENLKRTLDRAVNDDIDFSILAHEFDESKETSLFDVINCYFGYIKSLYEDIENIKEHLKCNVPNSAYETLVNTISFSDGKINEDETSFYFSVSVGFPFNQTIKFKLTEMDEENNDTSFINNKDKEGFTAITNIEEYGSDYVLSIKEVTPVSILIGNLFEYHISSDQLINIIRKLKISKSSISLNIHVENELPIKLFMNDGKVEIRTYDGNNSVVIFRVNYDSNVIEEVNSSETFCFSKDPAYYLDNLYIYDEEIDEDILEGESDRLDELFKRSNYKSYILEDEDDDDYYYYFKDGTKLTRIDDYESISLVDDYYTFKFDDGSELYINSSQVVIIKKEDQKYCDEPAAVKALKKWTN